MHVFFLKYRCLQLVQLALGLCPIPESQANMAAWVVAARLQQHVQLLHPPPVAPQEKRCYELDFGPVPVGQRVTRSIVLFNQVGSCRALTQHRVVRHTDQTQKVGSNEAQTCHVRAMWCEEARATRAPPGCSTRSTCSHALPLQTLPANQPHRASSLLTSAQSRWTTASSLPLSTLGASWRRDPGSAHCWPSHHSTEPPTCRCSPSGAAALGMP